MAPHASSIRYASRARSDWVCGAYAGTSKPPPRRRRWTITGRLVHDAVALDRVGKGRGIGRLAHLEGVEAGATHKQKLIAQYLSGGAQFAAEMISLAQDTRLRIGTAAEVPVSARSATCTSTRPGSSASIRPGVDELSRLDEAPAVDATSRLCCQIRMSPTRRSVVSSWNSRTALPAAA